jgi:hypothetical protein
MVTSAKGANTPRAFVVGPLRSGSTLLRLMLNHHPQIHWIGEFDYAVDRLGPGGRFPPLTQYHRWLTHNRTFVDQQLTLDPGLSYPALVDSFLSQARARAGKPLVGGTVHRRFDHLPALWPKARYIHLCRDGRDVARSWIGMGLGGTVYTGAWQWLAAERLADRLRQRVDDQQWLSISFEQLVREPEATLNRICTHLGVDYDPAMLQYNTASTYDRPDPALIAQWRHKLSPAALRRVEAICAPMLSQRGYTLASPPPLTLGPLEGRWLRWCDRYARTRFRARRVGWSLTLGYSAVRRLGLAGWRDRLNFRIEQLDRPYLK